MKETSRGINQSILWQQTDPRITYIAVLWQTIDRQYGIIIRRNCNSSQMMPIATNGVQRSLLIYIMYTRASNNKLSYRRWTAQRVIQTKSCQLLYNSIRTIASEKACNTWKTLKVTQCHRKWQNYWNCPYSTRSRVYVTVRCPVSVRPSVFLSVCTVATAEK